MKGVVTLAITWDEITYGNLFYLNEVLQLHDQVFSLEVREPHNIFLKSLLYATNSFPNTFRFLVGFEGKKIAAYATGHYRYNVNCGFIVYIATNPSVRSRGLGSQTLLELEKILNTDARSAGNQSLRAMVLETERAEFVHTIEEREDCVKRNRFFEKNGYQQFKEIDYLQPPLRDGEKIIPLNLFLKNFEKNTITLDKVKKVISAIYREKYSLVNATDTQILIDCLKGMDINTG